ncbi:tRNA dihydrouridine synthase DusB, partial [Pseudomonas aeruginosa]
MGPYTLPTRQILAPMAGETHRPFRQRCRRRGARIVESEKG